MIPLHLALTNFLSYRERAELDFRGIHLACISGPNGAGKSSILDGMTWALFGRSRSKSDDDVIHRTVARDGLATVEFTFALEGVVYRVIRRKRRQKSAELELQIAVESDGDRRAWKTLSEGRSRETQARIEDLLRMNYDVFTNASFLLQGKADEFTTKTPDKRKEILAEVLGVSRWSDYQKVVAEQRKSVEGDLALNEGLLSEIAEELAQEEERREALAVAEARVKEAAGQLSAQEEILDLLRRREHAAAQQRRQVATLATERDRAGAELRQLATTWEQKSAELATYRSLLDDSEEIEASYAAWRQAEADYEAWQEKAEAYARLLQARQPHEVETARERSRLESALNTYQAEERRVEAAVAERENLQPALAGDRARLAQIESVLVELSAQERAWREACGELQRLEGERRLWRQELEQLQRRAREAAEKRREEQEALVVVESAGREVAAASARMEALNAEHERYIAGVAERDTLDADQPRLRREMDRIKTRLDQLAAETGALCPLCGQPLSDDHRREVMAQLESEGNELGRRYRHNKSRIEQLFKELPELESAQKQRLGLERDLLAQRNRLAGAESTLMHARRWLEEWERSAAAERQAELEAQLADRSVLDAKEKEIAALADAPSRKEAQEQERRLVEQRIAQAEARLGEIERQERAWQESGKPGMAAVGRQLADNDYAQAAQAAMAEIDARLAQLAYDAAAHESARARRNQLADAPRRFQELQQAGAAVRPLADTVADLAGRREQLALRLADLEAQWEEAGRLLHELEADADRLPAVEQGVFRLREAVRQADQTVGAARQRLLVLEDRRKQREERTQTRETLGLRLTRLKRLEDACGRNGVQALLIDHARPEIEDRANELLDRLTGGEMKISFETQKQLKSRDALAETLDIRISDTSGERPYENFSGGEKFRVDFAIRLALSQVLARRAGASLKMMVIDEGFGSQDPEGRQRLVEAINVVQSDFACVLVITHIDELRDAFPNRIEVEKTREGSRLSVY